LPPVDHHKVSADRRGDGRGWGEEKEKKTTFQHGIDEGTEGGFTRISGL
jgi:hypothetical protein